MQVLFARHDIDKPNLKVRAGHPLPSRFQQSTIFTLKSLKEHLGPDAIISLTEDNKDYMLVSISKLQALEAENEQLRERIAALEDGEQRAPSRGRKAVGSENKEIQ